MAEEANFTRAAGRVPISQSGVSAQIRQLEHELGAPPAGLALIWTTTRSPALQEFLLHAHRAFTNPGDPATVGPVETFP